MAILKTNSYSAEALFDTGSELSAVSGDTFTLKVIKFDIETRTPLIEATQESDPTAAASVTATPEATPYIKFKHTGKVGGTARFEGLTIADTALGISALPDEEVDVKVFLGISGGGKKHSLSFRMAIEQVRVQWSRQNVGVPVTIVGKITNRFGNTGSNSVLETVAS
tara:strand:- start:6167 stop:6667 length:501 start_codon:yes stop_codon:yes gene_type:complete